VLFALLATLAAVGLAIPVGSSAAIGMTGSNSSRTSRDITHRLQNDDEIRSEGGLRFPRRLNQHRPSSGKEANRSERRRHLRHHVGSPHFLCTATAIYGITRNDTSLPITLQSIEHGATNAWCDLDTNDVPPHSQNDWLIGDTFFGTSVDLIYSIPTPNHTPDYFDFQAHEGFMGIGGGGASCAPITYITGEPNSGTFKCHTSFSEGMSPNSTSADFIISP
jgi:hypothetical protein